MSRRRMAHPCPCTAYVLGRPPLLLRPYAASCLHGKPPSRPLPCRAGIPVVAAIGSVFIESKTPTRKEFLSLFIVVFGVAIAVWEGSDSKASITGIILCVLGEDLG